MARNLPVRVYSAREIDYHLPEPTGPQQPPKWLLKGESLQKRSEELSEQVKDLGPLFKKRKEADNYIPAVLKVKTDDRATAKTHQIPVENLLNLPLKRNIIGVIGDS